MDRNILYVDDEPGITRLVEYWFESRSKNYRFKAAKSNEAAFDLLETFKPDLVITDLKHDGEGTGIDLSLAIRKSYDKKMPIICASGNSDWIVRISKDYFNAVLNKPFNIFILEGIIEELLSPSPHGESFFYAECSDDRFPLIIEHLDFKDKTGIDAFFNKISSPNLINKDIPIGFEKCGSNRVKLTGLQNEFCEAFEYGEVKKFMEQQAKLYFKHPPKFCFSPCRFESKYFAQLTIKENNAAG